MKGAKVIVTKPNGKQFKAEILGMEGDRWSSCDIKIDKGYAYVERTHTYDGKYITPSLRSRYEVPLSWITAQSLNK